jgi:hypothetical protein
MRVSFIHGPLDGDVREIPDEDLRDGSVIVVSSAVPQDDPAIPGDERLIEYLYEGDGQARYVAGIAER